MSAAVPLPAGPRPEAGQPPSDVLDAVRAIVSEVLAVPVDQVTAASRITELDHVESIKLLRIAGRIERRFAVELDDDVVFRGGTLGDLAREVAALRTGERG